MSSSAPLATAPAVDAAGASPDLTKGEDAPPCGGGAAAAAEPVKPAEKHYPVSKQEVDEFASRMEEISRVLHEYLNEDPVAAAEKQRAREAARAKERADAERQKLLDRYDPRRYVRFESDELINRLLEEVDKPPPPKPVSSRVTHLSEFEQLSLEEAERQKSEGNACFKKGDYVRAKELYTRALELTGNLDDALIEAIQNNRGQVNIFLKEFVAAVEDTTAVLQRHPTNVKARLRRATALSALHRPNEALQDLREALKGEPRNAEALRLLDAVKLEKKEMDWCSEFERGSKSGCSALKEAIVTLEQYLATLCNRDEASDACAGGASVAAMESSLPPSSSSSRGKEVVIRARDAAGLVNTLAQCQEYLWERGAPTFFRIHGGLTAVRKLVEIWVADVKESRVMVVRGGDGDSGAGNGDGDRGKRSKRSAPGRDDEFLFATAVAAAVRTLAEALKSEVAIDSLTPADAARYSDVAVGLLFRDGEVCRRVVEATAEGDLEEPLTRSSAAKSPSASSSGAAALGGGRSAASGGVNNKDQHRHRVEELLCTAALLLCESLCPKFASVVVEHLTAVTATKVLQLSLGNSRGGLAVLYRSLKLFDVLLRCDAAASAYADVDFVLPSLAALAQPSLAFGEVSTGMLLRLSVALPRKLDVLSKPEVLRSVCEITTRALAPAVPSGRRSETTEEETATSPLLQEGLCSLLYNRLLLQDSTSREDFVSFLDKHGVYSRIYEFLVAYASSLQAASAASARPLLSVAKACLALVGKSLAAHNASLNALAAKHIDALWHMFDVLRLFPVPTAVGSAPKELSENQEDPAYARQVVEQASLCLAHLYTGDKAVLTPETLNKRDVLSTLLDCLVLKEQPVTVGNVALILSVVPKEAHAHMETLDAVKRILAALVAMRTEIFHLESEGQRESTTHRHTKAAQKNLAIALSRLCATESLLLQVREQRGFEILYAALDRNPDGSIKDDKARGA